MTTSYFIDSRRGKDTNAGTSYAAPWASLAMLRSATPGSIVYPSRGSIFREPLPPLPPGIVIDGGRFGEGAAAIIDGSGARSILAGIATGLTLRELRLQNSQRRHVELAPGSSHVTLEGVAFTNNGNDGSTHVNDYYQAVYAKGCNTLAILNCNFAAGGWGDGVFLDGCTGALVLVSNDMGTPQGANADNVQIVGVASDFTNATVLIAGNDMDMTGFTNSGKGNLCINNMRGSITVQDNTMYGRNYCCALNSHDVTAQRNTLSGAGLNDYSWGLGVSEAWAVRNHVYEGNTISACVRGVAFSGPPGTMPTRTDMVVQGNTISACAQGLRVDRPTSGVFVENTLLACATDHSITTQVVPVGGAYSTFEVD